MYTHEEEHQKQLDTREQKEYYLETHGLVPKNIHKLIRSQTDKTKQQVFDNFCNQLSIDDKILPVESDLERDRRNP